MLSQDVSILSFVLSVPGQSIGKPRENWKGPGDLEQQQHVGTLQLCIHTAGDHAAVLLDAVWSSPCPVSWAISGARLLQRSPYAPWAGQATESSKAVAGRQRDISLGSRTGSWLQLPTLSMQLGSTAHAIHSTSLYFKLLSILICRNRLLSCCETVFLSPSDLQFRIETVSFDMSCSHQSDQAAP